MSELVSMYQAASKSERRKINEQLMLRVNTGVVWCVTQLLEFGWAKGRIAEVMGEATKMIGDSVVNTRTAWKDPIRSSQVYGVRAAVALHEREKELKRIDE